MAFGLEKFFKSSALHNPSAPLLGVKPADLARKEADVLRAHYTRSQSKIYYVKNFKLIFRVKLFDIYVFGLR
jgi:hypothetical protein